MPRRLFEEMNNWAGGINTAANADALSVGVSPRGLNSALVQISPNPPRALAGKRKGALPALTTPLTSEPAIIGQFYFQKSDGNDYHILVCGDGSLRKRLSDGSHSIISGSAFTAGNSLLPSFAVANDLLFITNGTEKKKFDGTNLTPFGITAPSAAPVVTATGSGGTMAAATWDVLITYYNDNTGAESGISTSASATLTAGQKLSVDWSALTPESQVTHVMVYVRNQSVGPNYYRAIVGSTPASASNGGFPVATTSAIFDITPTQFENLRILAPEDTENAPPPTGAKSPTWHRARMFVHDGVNIYWSEIEEPENFDLTNRYEPINPDDGDTIVALFSAHDRLLIFKNYSTWALVGTDPSSWEVEMVSPSLGAVNQQCIVSALGDTYWWDRQFGPVAYGGQGSPEPIGIPTIGPTINPELLATDQLGLIVATFDDNPSRQRVMWAIPEVGQTRNSMILPFNVLLRVWESDSWNPFDVASMVVAHDEDGTPWVFIGGFSGRLFQWWNATNDGVPEEAVHTGSITAATSTTITCVDEENASPAWVTDELKELYVYAISADGLDVQRKRILSNTANVITVSSWGTTPNSTYTFVVGGIDFQWDTPWITGEAPFHKKRYEYLFMQLSSPDSGVPVTVDLFLNYDLLNAQRSQVVELLGTVVYDSAIYDQDRYVSAVLADERLRVSKTGKAWRARFRNIYPDQELTFLKVAMQSVLLNTKS
jgi:hypothetical protein